MNTNFSEKNIYIKTHLKWQHAFFDWTKIFQIGKYKQLYTAVIRLPLHMESIDIATDNGQISIKNIEADHIQLKTSNGKLKLENMVATTLSMKTSNGNIELNDLNISEKLSGESKNGRVELTRISALDMHLNTSNGRIIASSVTSDNIYLKTSNGRIELSLFRTFETYKTKIKTSNGTVKINDKKYGNDTYHEEAVKALTLLTSNGRIIVTFK